VGHWRGSLAQIAVLASDLLVVAIVLVIGRLVDVTAAIILVPLGASYGFDPVHFGVILCVMLVYANVTPPVGLLVFRTASTARHDRSSCQVKAGKRQMGSRSESHDRTGPAHVSLPVSSR
jgi:TRAP-type C4-dicarboxylate transport system permease large subunit